MKASPVFPPSRLPPGFLATLQNPPDPPATPRPSATLVPLRSGTTGLEVLLLERSPRSGFIPGAWVFPGGTLDPEDEDLNAWGRHPPSPLEPPEAFWVAALRETFEETGILIQEKGRRAVPAEDLGNARASLLAGEATFDAVLSDLGARLDVSRMTYTAHWVTPECEPRRYETRFFMADVENETRVDPHQAEMVDAVWLAPTEALDRNRAGTLPMVYPTISALEELTPFATPAEALRGLRGRRISRCLPVPEQTPAGVRFLLP